MRVTSTTLISYLFGCAALLIPDITGAQLRPPQPLRVGPTVPVSIADTGSLMRAWRKDRFASPRYLQGTLRAVTPESLAIESAHRGVILSLALDSISKLEIGAGSVDPGSTIRMTAFVGGVAGAWSGFQILPVICFCDMSSEGATPLRLAFAVSGILVGAAVGGAIGAVLPAPQDWREIPLRP